MYMYVGLHLITSYFIVHCEDSVRTCLRAYVPTHLPILHKPFSGLSISPIRSLADWQLYQVS